MSWEEMEKMQEIICQLLKGLDVYVIVEQMMVLFFMNIR